MHLMVQAYHLDPKVSNGQTGIGEDFLILLEDLYLSIGSDLCIYPVQFYVL